MNRTTGISIAFAIALGVVTAACGDDDEAADTTSAAAPTTAAPATTGPAPSTAAPATTTGPAPTTAAPATTTGAEAETVSVVMSDYAFGGLPETAPAGVKLQVENTSTKEMHELVAFRIPDDEQRPVEELVKLPEQELGAIFGAGPPAAVLLAPPGGEQIAAVGDGTLAEPGRYAIACFIPKGADPQAYMEAAQGGEGPPEVDGGAPHFVHGMFAELVVE